MILLSLRFSYTCMYGVGVGADAHILLLQQQLQSGMSLEEMAQHQIVNIEDSLRIGSMSSTSTDIEYRP